MLLDYLQDQGYEPTDDVLVDSPLGRRVDVFDLTVSGTGTARLVIYPDDDYRADVRRFDRYMVETWSAVFYNAPDGAILGALAAAENDLAVLRGGPVCPRQQESL